MEAFSSLIRGHLPPVGRQIIYSPLDSDQELPVFDGYFSAWVDSGTSALALAFLKAKSLRPSISSPEVILPGYCCPDLVAAAHYAGLVPKIVDISADDPALDIEALRKCISKNTLAIVAINFLGIAEDLDVLLTFRENYPEVFIVEDNAQWFPQEEERSCLVGDFVTFSFGRGKPVSLLGGGLLLSRFEYQANFLGGLVHAASCEPKISRYKLQAKYFVYNQILSPFYYQFLTRNPFLNLGQTKYHALDSITELDCYRKKLLLSNIKNFQSSQYRSIIDSYTELFSQIGFTNNFKALATARARRLLRYPVLFSSSHQKEKVFRRLHAHGLGATELYKADLPRIDGVEGLSICGELERAGSFASRFITLPVHAGVRKEHLQMIKEAFQD